MLRRSCTGVNDYLTVGKCTVEGRPYSPRDSRCVITTFRFNLVWEKVPS